MKLFKSKIDKLASEKRHLKIKQQNIKDRMHEKNSAIETKLAKLENKAQYLKEVADKQCVEIDRQLQKFVVVFFYKKNISSEMLKILQDYLFYYNIRLITQMLFHLL